MPAVLSRCRTSRCRPSLVHATGRYTVSGESCARKGADRFSSSGAPPAAGTTINGTVPLLVRIVGIAETDECQVQIVVVMERADRNADCHHAYWKGWLQAEVAVAVSEVNPRVAVIAGHDKVGAAIPVEIGGCDRVRFPPVGGQQAGRREVACAVSQQDCDAARHSHRHVEVGVLVEIGDSDRLTTEQIARRDDRHGPWRLE